MENEEISKDGKFTQRQELFIEGVVLGKTGGKAARDAGYADNSADQQASALLKNHKVMSEIDRRQAEFRKKNKVKKEDMVRLLTAIKDADIRDYVKFNGKRLVFKSFDELTNDQAMAIESIKMGKNGIELKLHGKSWAADQLNKHLGTYEADNAQKGDKAPRVLIQLPDNKRGKVTVIDENKPKEDEQ